MAKRKLAESSCACCGREVVWKESDTGALAYTCQHCDFQVYAKHGTEAKRLTLAALKLDPSTSAPNTHKPKPNQSSPEPAPASAPKSASFMLGLGG